MSIFFTERHYTHFAGVSIMADVTMPVSLSDDAASVEIFNDLVKHEPLIHQFATEWYRSPYTYRSTKVLGWPACKVPMDLWVLHDLFCQYRFQSVVECGTAGGGTTLWYAILMDLLGIEGGKIYSIDLDTAEQHGGHRPQHPRITYVHGSTIDPALVEGVAACLTGATLINLDSDHRAQHVIAELRLWAPYVPVGGWLLVEDTNGAPADGPPVDGPLTAVRVYLAQHPGEFHRELACERFWLTMNPGGWLQRVKPITT